MFNENDPNKSKAIFSGPNHASAVVDLPDGTSWLLHPVWLEPIMMMVWSGTSRVN